MKPSPHSPMGGARAGSSTVPPMHEIRLLPIASLGVRSLATPSGVTISSVPFSNAQTASGPGPAIGLLTMARKQIVSHSVSDMLRSIGVT